MTSAIMRKFSLNGLEYMVYITKLGEFAFHVVGGSSRKGTIYDHKRDRYNLFPEERLVEDIDLNPYALPVFRKAGEILLEWMCTKNPWRIYFSASTPRKIKVYRWLANRLVKRQLSGYQLVEYPEGVFNFFRLVCPSDTTRLENMTSQHDNHNQESPLKLQNSHQRENLIRYCHPAFWALGGDDD